MTQGMIQDITLDDIRAAERRIADHIQPLRISRSESLSQRFACEILLAHEYLQTYQALGVRLRVLGRLAQSADHPIHPGMPETEYLKGFLAEVRRP